ncbi:MAG: glycoside hydrolase family 88 protein, partial [Paraprevotella sp.]|nr:glycoside hydrolase family 88 protein [Paraprevotella sp.]
LYDEYQETDAQMEQILHPRALDDAGAMCCAMMKAGIADPTLQLDEIIENYFRFIEHGQYRLPDGTFARHRPQYNTIWLDDMFMGIPSVAYRGLYKPQQSQHYFDEAAKISRQFMQRMFVPEKNLYRHGYVEGLAQQPTYHWARANGWAILTNCQVLDVLPENHPQRPYLLEQLRAHIKGLASYQSSEGFWHQLVYRNDSYLETSATAIYVYCIAHAINKGWIDAITYGPVAQLGWHAVSTKILEGGQVDGTCVGTGMAFDPAFYYYRPANYQAAHGYGPVIWAGAEMIRLLQQWYPRTNDSGLHYYDVEQTNPSPLFYLTEDGKGEAVK